MPDENKLGGSVGLDTTGFKKGVTDLNSQIKSIETSFRASAVVMGSWGEKSDGLKLRADSLNEKLTLQKQKLSILTEEYNKAISAENKDEKAIASLANQMFSAEKAISGTESDIKKYNTQLGEMETGESKAAAESKKLTDAIEATSAKAKKLGSDLESAGKKVSDVGSKMTIGITAPILAAGVASVKLASDMNETLNKVDVAFGGSANAVKSWSDTTLEKFGLAKGSALDATSTYGDMATSMGFTTGAAAKMSQTLVGLSADMSSFKNIPIAESQTALNAIFTGETESLKQLGIVMTEANLQDYAATQGIKTKVTAMSEQEKVQLRYNYILSVTKNSQGDFARTSDSAANQARMFQETLKQLGETFGQEILPEITPIISGLNGMLKSFASLDSGTKQTIITVAAVAAALGPLTIGAGKVISAVGGAVKVIDGLKAASAASAVASAAAASGEAATGVAAVTATPGVIAFGTAFKAALGPIGLAIAAIAAIAIAYQASASKIEAARQKIIDAKYDKLTSENNAYYEGELNNLEKEKNNISDSLAKREKELNDYYDKAETAAEGYVKTTQKTLQKENEAYTAAHEKRIKELDEEKKKRLDEIDSSANTATLQVQNQIDAIDNKTAAEDKALKDKDNKQKESDLRAAIDAAQTLDTKKVAQQALDDFLAQLARDQLLQQRDVQKQVLQDQITNIKAQSDKQKTAVETDIQNQKDAADANLKTQQQSVSDRLGALDGYVVGEKVRLEASKANALATEQEKTKNHNAEIDIRIAKEQELQAAMDKTIAKQKQAETEKNKATPGEVVGSWWDTIVKAMNNSYMFGSNYRAIGDNNWRGGPVHVNEEGGEILNLPRGTQIIPHDVSMEAARAYGNQTNVSSSSTSNYNQYGAQQQVTVLQIGSEKIATVVTPTVSNVLANTGASMRRSLGYA